MFHMGTNLMCTSCFKNTLHQCYISISLHNTIMSHGRLAYLRIGREHIHTQTVFRIAPDVTFYPTLVFNKVSPYQSIITAMCSLIKELFSQRCFSIWCLSHHKQSAGILVNTVHQSHFWIIRIITFQILKMPGYGIYQCTVKVSTTRMHNHTCRFIYNHQVIVFIYHLKWNILRLNSCIVVRTIKHQRYYIARAYLIITLNGFIVYMNETGISSLLDTITT